MTEELRGFSKRILIPGLLVTGLGVLVFVLAGEASGSRLGAGAAIQLAGVDEDSSSTSAGDWRSSRRRVTFRPGHRGSSERYRDPDDTSGSRSVVTRLPGGKNRSPSSERKSSDSVAELKIKASPVGPASTEPSSGMLWSGKAGSALPSSSPDESSVDSQAPPPSTNAFSEAPRDGSDRAVGSAARADAFAAASKRRAKEGSRQEPELLKVVIDPDSTDGGLFDAGSADRNPSGARNRDLRVARRLGSDPSRPIAQISFGDSERGEAFDGLSPRSRRDPQAESGQSQRFRAPPARRALGEESAYDGTSLGQGPMPPVGPDALPLPTPEPPQPVFPGGGIEGTVGVDFKDTELRSIVKLISDKTKVNYLLDDLHPLNGKVTVLGPSKLTVAEAELLLMALLDFKGYAIEEVGKRVRRIVMKDRAKSAFIPFRRQLPAASGSPTANDLEQICIQTFKLKHIGVNDTTQVLRFFMASGNTAANTILSYVPGNMLFVIDNEFNLRRIAEILAEIDVPGPSRKITPIRINHAPAKALADKITQLLAKRTEGEIDPGTRESKLSKPALFPDERTNSILLICLEDDVRMVVALIEQLDVPDIYTPIIKVIHLQCSEAESVANSVNQAFKVGGSSDPSLQYTVIADQRSQSLILSSFSSKMLEKVEELIHFLDNAVTPADGINVHHYRMEYGDATKVEKILSGMESSQTQQKGAAPTKIIADESTNALVIVASQAKYQDILKILQKLDTLRPQVLVETLIVELTQSLLNNLGADFNIIPNTEGTRVVGLGNTGAASSLFSSSNGGMHLGVIAPGPFDINAASQGNVAERSKIQYLINMFKQDNRSNILQSPRLMAVDNSTSKITVGSKVQVLQGMSQSTGSNQIPYANFTSEDLGLTMEITPRITKGDWVSLKLKAELKDRISGAEGTISFGSFQTPVFTKTSVENEVVVKNRETLVIGGLLKESKGKQLSKIPGLGDLPIVGRLFQSRNRNLDKKDLLVFVTPHIVRDGFNARRVTKAEERPLQWRDITGHTWPHDRGLPITPQQIQQDLKRGGGEPVRKIYHKPPRVEEAFRQ